MSELKSNLEISLSKDVLQDTRESVSSKNTNDSLLSSEDSDDFNENHFEEICRKFYVNSADNSNSNFNAYIQSALHIIANYPKKEHFKGEIEKKKIEIEHTSHKKILILDLDETLVHADVDFNYKYHDEILKFIPEGGNEEILIPLILRPHLFEFLNFASSLYELVIFTASEKNYADVILNFIEKDKKYFAYRLYRDNCIYLHPCFYIKDLDIIANIKKENLLIVDNSLFSFGNNLNNGILISSFYNDKDDTMLCNLAHYLSHLSNVDDVRTANKETFNFEHYLSVIKEEK